ncbi:MAG: aminoglycoside 3'-phosphotransferase [Clostridia bacterium]|nr:aminoglycoside 3'-phosphotransferase [Clostridia bacterium]
MELKPIKVNLDDYPTTLRPYLEDANLYDSSCSADAKVLFSDKDEGYYIKISQAGTLQTEAMMTNYFHSLDLSPKVSEYLSIDKDFLVTNKVIGNDCIHSKYLEQPEKLCDTLAESLRLLHSMSYSNCPVKNRTANYLDAAQKNYIAGVCDKTLLKQCGFKSPDEAWDFVKTNRSLLKTDTLAHGDYCLPNVIFYNWKLSGLIDVGFGGVSDRHVDIFWGIWSLYHNLKTNAFTNRFIDAYGRTLVDDEVLRLIASIEIFG